MYSKVKCIMYVQFLKDVFLPICRHGSATLDSRNGGNMKVMVLFFWNQEGQNSNVASLHSVQLNGICGPIFLHVHSSLQNIPNSAL